MLASTSAAVSAAVSSRTVLWPTLDGERSDDGKKFSVVFVKLPVGVGEGLVGEDKAFERVVLLDGSVGEVVQCCDHFVAHLIRFGIVCHSVVGNAGELD